MKNRYLLLLLLFTILYNGFSSDTLLVKYWNYKQNFLERNVRIGTDPGMSMPVESFQYSDCRWDWVWWGYPWDSLRDGRGIQNVGGDQTVYHGQYLALLATEYGLLTINNQDADSTLRELYYALKAYYRLEQKANDIFHTSNYTGFFVRTDAQNDFYTKFQDEFIPEDKKPKCTLAEEPRRAISPDSLITNFTSQDQVIHLLFGLAMVKRFVPANIMYNGESVLALAQDIAKRMVKRFYDDNWNLRDPSGNHLGNERGGEAWPWAYGLDKSYAFISADGNTFGDYNSNGGDIALKTLWDCCAHLGGVTHFYNRRLYISMVTSSNVKTVNFNFTYTFKDGMYIYPLAQAVMHNLTLDESKATLLLDTLQKALMEAPNFGPCLSVDGWNPDCPMTKGWISQNRWLVSDPKDRDTIADTNNHPANQNGIDYMLAYNLYKLYTNPIGYYNTNHPISTGVHNSKSENYDFTIFPNPTHNKITIKVFIPKATIITLKLVDVFGRVIVEQKQQSNISNSYLMTNINFPESLSNGMYFCQIEIDGVLIQKSVIKV